MSKLKPLLTISLAFIKRHLLLFAVFVFTGTATLASSLSWLPKLNTHYQEIAATENLGIEQPIVLYCWLASPSCYQLETALKEWATANNQTIANQPIIMRPHWRMLAKARLVAREMAQEDLVVDAIYKRLHIEKQSIASEEELFMVIETLGISASRFANLFYSAETNTQLKTYENQAQRLALRGAPSLIINGRWLMDAGMLKTPREFLQTIEYLVQEKSP